MLLPGLPIQVDVETIAVLRKTVKANRALAELKGLVNSLPNGNIFIETLALREARESSAIENIISTAADVYQSNIVNAQFTTSSAKEVHLYAKALKKGFDLVLENNLLTNNIILQIQATVEQNSAGFRKLPGTALLNDRTGEVVYTPPQEAEVIISLMANLEKFINDDGLSDLDPLIKMAIIHHQFESIHPFYDGNGRTGRIINILYLIQKKLLDLPVLYMSKFIIEHKGDYYRLLQKVRIENEWEEWIIFMLTGIEQTAKESLVLISKMQHLMQRTKQNLRKKLPKLYSQDLLNNLFKYPYTKIEYLEQELNISRSTSIRYLETLVQENFLEKKKIGRDNFYIHKTLFELLS